jgi:hypothetical protein
VYIGYVHDEQLLSVKNEYLLFTPSGLNGSLSFDLNDSWSLNASYSQLTDEIFINLPKKELEITSWAVGLDYYQDSWGISASYGDWQEELLVSRKSDVALSSQKSDAPNFSVHFNYDYLLEAWQLSGFIGANYIKWQHLDNDYIIDEPNPSLSLQKQSVFFGNVGLSLTRLYESNKRSIFFGGGISRGFQLSSDDTNTTDYTINLRRTTRRFNNTNRNLTSSNANNNYTQISMFISYPVTNNLNVDIDTQINLEEQDNYQSYSLGASYSF